MQYDMRIRASWSDELERSNDRVIFLRRDPWRIIISSITLGKWYVRSAESKRGNREHQQKGRPRRGKIRETTT